MSVSLLEHNDQSSPAGCGNTGNPVLRGNLTLVDAHCRETSSVLVPVKGMGSYRGDVDFSTEVSREIAEMGSLFDDGTGANQRHSATYIVDRKTAHLLDLSHQSGFAIDS